MLNSIVTLLLSAGAVGIFIGMLLESACLPIPSEIILPFAGILVGKGYLSFIEAILIATTGQLTGSLIVYYLGKKSGISIVRKYGRYIGVKTHEIEKARVLFQKYGEITVSLGRLLPGVRTFISLPAGLASVPLSRFIIYSIVGILPWTTFLIWAGLKVGAVWKNPLWHPYFQAAQIVTLLIIGFTALYFLSRKKNTTRSL